MSNNIRLNNFLLYDNKLFGLEIYDSSLPKNAVNTSFNNIFENSKIIGNSDSLSAHAITETGVGLNQGVAMLMKSIAFYNFPNFESNAISGPDKCRYV